MARETLSFIRSHCLRPVLSVVEQKYGICPGDLGVPGSLLAEEMSLIPHPDINDWYQRIEILCDDPGYMLKSPEALMFNNVGGLGQWFVDAADLSTCMRRINFGINCLQSGAICYTGLSSKLVKWSYQNPFGTERALAHDALRMAILLVNSLRHYLGERYSPVRVELAGEELSSRAAAAFFGCEVSWRAAETRIWLQLDDLTRAFRQPSNQDLAVMPAATTWEDYLTMPQPADISKSLVEMVNFSRHFGYPSLAFIASRYQISTQQLQRRLVSYGWNFKRMVTYVLCNLAIDYFKQGLSVDEVAGRLGYSNTQSFIKAFKRMRGQTPGQYLGQSGSPI